MDGGLLLPSGITMRYTNLRNDKDDGFMYDARKNEVVRIYGGKVVENIVQALARIVIGHQMLKIAERYRVVLTVHDAVACIAPETEVLEAKRSVEECMRSAPDWAVGLPLNCESGYGRSYGDC